MKIIIKIFLVILITCQFSCMYNNQIKEKEATVDTAKAEKKLFANIQFASKKDTSCGMPLSAGVEDTVHLKNKIYGFCSKECKDDFVNKLKTEKKR